MIPSQNLIDKICCKINQGGLTALETCQTTNALTLLDNNPVVQVATASALPSASLYTGRMIYVNDENRYYFSTGVSWLKDFTSSPSIYAREAWAWGFNAFAQLGDGTTIQKSSPILVIGGFTDWCQISAGAVNNAAIRTNGTAWIWSSGYCGMLGDGTTVNKFSPVQVCGGFTDWCQVSAGCHHITGVRSNGTAWAWGRNTSGHLGDGTTINRSSPVSVAGGFVDWCQIAAGNNHTLALRSNGTAWAWGCSGGGKLGDGTIVNKSSPVSVVGGFTDWCDISAGDSSFGIRTNGTLWAWGWGTDGKLGDGTTTNKSSPVSVVGGFTNWCDISAGESHTLAIRTNGTIWAWGNNSNGRLGDGTVATKCSPVSVVSGSNTWLQVSAGCDHSTAISSISKGF